jgi:uncharacterized protein (DUF362 family)
MRLLGGVGLAGAAETLAGCVPSKAWPGRTPDTVAVPAAATRPSPVPLAPPHMGSPTGVPPTLPPAETPAPTAAHVVGSESASAERSEGVVPISLDDLFDESTLTPVYVAYDPDVQGYPLSPPFDPETSYPEYPYPRGGDQAGVENGCYRLVREALRLFSPTGYGTADWNPLSTIIRPGDRVLIKPNLVDDSAWQQGQITHPAFLRPILDYAVKACGPGGQVIVGEGPWAAGVFDRLVQTTGIQAMVDHLVQAHGAPIRLQDLNKCGREETPLVDLGAASALTLDAGRITWLDAHYEPMKPGGDPGVGRYRIAPVVLQADVVISVPKVKVHCSAGATLTMKNMLGIIPAWDGPYGKAELKDCAHASDVDMAQGNRGKYLNNDTIWRSMADLNRILLYADASGRLQATRQRRYLTIVDGIVAAEESQYKPHPRPLGTVVIGADPVTCDAVTARVMGFDPRKLRSVVCPEQIATHPLGPWRAADVRLVTSWARRQSRAQRGSGGLNAVYRAALTPELHVYSWLGQVEADDFDPPQVQSVTWDPETGELHIQAGDPAGVAYIRLAYGYQGQRYVHELTLAAGDARSGEWRVPFPVGAVVKNGELTVADELFNADTVAVGW